MPLSLKSKSLFRRASKDKRGNVLMFMGFALIPITIAAGMTVDYTRAARLKTKLDAAADAAVLSAVAEAASTATDKEVCERAARLFHSQASAINNIDYNKANITLSVGSNSTPNNSTYNGATDTCSTPAGAVSSATRRVVSMTYVANSRNAFAGVLDRSTLPVSGRAGSRVTIPPNIDFYVMMDTSPSMLFPTTQVGINTMISEGGCAFACHQGDQSASAPDMRWYRGLWVDSYGVALKYNADEPDATKHIKFRYNAALEAVSSLMPFAYNQGTTNETQYRVAIRHFDKSVQNLQDITVVTNGTAGYPTTNRDALAVVAQTAPIYKPWRNGLDATGVSDNDQQTHFDSMMQALNTSGGPFFVPNAGNGTNAIGDSPEKIVFLVTDGFNEQSRYNNPGFGTVDVSKCNALKARGIRIAILYLRVYPSGWAPGDNKIADSKASLEQCASPQLLYTVSTGDNITAALQALFEQATSKPRLIN